MPIDASVVRSRRALLGAAAGALAALAGQALGRPFPVSAHDPDDVRLGGAANTAASVTTITNTTEHENAFEANATGAGIGVFGHSESHFGVFGGSGSGTGVKGSSGASDQAAAVGQAAGDSTGVFGISGVGSPPAIAKSGVYGYASQDGESVGVRGTSATGRGGLFKGKAAQLRLSPSSAATHPASGQLGDLFVDKNKRLWFCKGGTTWKQLG